MKSKIVTIVGARPQFVKAAVISRILGMKNDVQEVIVHTGQHYDEKMSNVFFETMDIPKPKYNLEVNGLDHGAMTGQMLEKIEQVLKIEQPDWVIVYGDTNSTLAGALAAKKMHIKVAHVEAGLRSFNEKMPEEINRVLTDRISDLLFAPTTVAVENLSSEGFDKMPNEVVLSGDVMQDASMFYAKTSHEKTGLSAELLQDDFILCTVHRAENTDCPERLKAIVNALNNIHGQIRVILPLHPRTAAAIKEQNLELEVDFIEPVGYFDMIELLKNCKLVMTDSGGLQKEAYFFEKCCVTLRDETEWVELVNHGYNVLTGAVADKIEIEVARMLTKNADFSKQLYGEGNAGEKIVEAILKN